MIENKLNLNIPYVIIAILFTLILEVYPANAIVTRDWRNYNGGNYITPIKDQGQICGSCWAFAAVANVEAAARIYGNDQAISIDLSEQDLVDCFVPIKGSGGCRGIQAGADNEDANKLYGEYFNDGIVSESCNTYADISSGCSAPYSSDCTNGKWKANIGANNVEIAINNAASTATEIQSNINLIKQVIIDHGPVAVVMDIYDDFYAYTGGIYSHTGKLVSSHSVLIVGFGTEKGKDYYIAKNSWGEDVQENGFFRIYANDSNISVYSAFYVENVLPPSTSPSPSDTEPPDIPLGSICTRTSESAFHMTWTKPYDNVGVIGYIIINPLTSKPNFTIYNTDANIEYDYYDDDLIWNEDKYQSGLVAFDAAGNRSGTPGNYAFCNIPSYTGPDVIAPSIPVNLQGNSPNSNRINLSWSESTDNRDNVYPVHYRLYRNGVEIADISSPNVVNYSDTNVTAGTTYQYNIQAYDNAGNESGLSNSVSVTVASAPPPPPPPPPPAKPSTSNLEGESRHSKIVELSWTPSAGQAGIAGYKIYRNGMLLPSTVTTNYFTDIGLTPDTTYTYTIKAVDTAGQYSDQSNTVSVKTLYFRYGMQNYILK